MDANKARQLAKESQIQFAQWDKEIEMRARAGNHSFLIETSDKTVLDYYFRKGFSVKFILLWGHNYLEIRW